MPVEYLADSIAILIIRPRHNVKSTFFMRPAILPVSLKLLIHNWSRARVKVGDREKLAQSETSTRASSPPDAPCPPTDPVRSLAYGCTRLNKLRLLLAFPSLLPSNLYLQLLGLQIPSPSQIVLLSPSSISAPPYPSPPSTPKISTAFSVRGSPLPTKSTVSARLLCPSGGTSFRFGLESFS